MRAATTRFYQDLGEDYEELVNRCLVLTINESHEQTRLIQQRQRARKTLAGLMAQSEAEAVTQLHQHAQRLLWPLAVVI